MTPLRQKMIQDMQLYRLASSTQDSYLRSVTGLAKYYKKSPDKIEEDELKRYILYLANERGLRWSSINMITSGLRFFYSNTIDRKDLAFERAVKKMGINFQFLLYYRFCLLHPAPFLIKYVQYGS